jgi:hypothetical protein
MVCEDTDHRKNDFIGKSFCTKKFTNARLSAPYKTIPLPLQNIQLP